MVTVPISFCEKFQSNNRISRTGDNCNIGDIITWNMKKNKEQLFGIITKKHNTCIYVDILHNKIYNNILYLDKIDKVDDVCYNKLLYTRKLIIIKSNI